MKGSFDCIERPLSVFFFRYGQHVSFHPLLYILCPLVFTLAMSLGMLNLNPVTDAVYLFTPTDARSKVERQIIHALWPLHSNNYIPGRAVTQSREVQITVVARDGGNILHKEYAEAIHRLDQYIEERIKVVYGNRTWSYSDLCLQWKKNGCPGNKHIQLISDLYNHGLNVSYPMFRLGSSSGYLGSSLGGVSLVRGANGTNFVASARAWFMIYHLQFHPENVTYISGLWEKAMESALLAYPTDPYITFTFFHSQTLAEELKRNADTLVPRFVLAFCILILFSLLCSLVFLPSSFCIDWVLSKPTLSVLGVLNAGMGVLSAIGSLNLLGVTYNDIVAVMPFLVVAVGVDNMFLMVAAMRRANRAQSVAKRMGEAMSDAAISILITALTDAFSFGVGAITSIPAVQIFCIYTGVAIAFTFVYQVTFFCALLSLSVKWEAEGRHCIWMMETVPLEKKKEVNWLVRLTFLGSRADPDMSNVTVNRCESGMSHFFRTWYAPVLMTWPVKALSFIWFIVYLVGATYGITQLREGLEPINLLVDDSYAIPHYHNLEEYFWHYGAALQVVVNNAPDMRDPLARAEVRRLVEAMASTKHSAGIDAVQFWLDDMERYYNKELKIPIRDDAFYSMIQHFFSAHANNDQWSEDVKWNENATIITAFRFVIGMRDISRTQEQQEATAVMRQVADQFPLLNVTTFSPLWLFTDQYALVVPNTVQNIVIALIVMLIISFLLIPQPLCALWVAFAIASIDFGVVGYMTLWNVNLDAISMITIIMSIGFSVDYSAHITYGYVISAEHDPNDRVASALGSLGWPLAQGAISTILAVAVLANIPAYMIVTFFKTVLLAISIGLVHGIIFLPVFLSVFVRGCCILGSPEECLQKKVEKAIIKQQYSSPSVRMPSLTAADEVQPVGRYGIFLSRINSLEEPMPTPPSPIAPIRTPK